MKKLRGYPKKLKEWIKGEEEDKIRATEEAYRKAEEAVKREEEERKRKLDEELKKQEAEKIKLTQIVTEQSAFDAADCQAQDL